MLSFTEFCRMLGGNSQTFEVNYVAFSIGMLPGNQRVDIEKGGKILLPPSALAQLTQLSPENFHPMLFELTNLENSRSTHAGVLEFIADENICYMPSWMMKNLALENGQNINIKKAILPVATYSKFQPLSADFFEITNAKAVLENILRNFACLTTGDVIAISYNKKMYELSVLETKPGLGAVSIIECDMNVEFETPVGYEPPTSSAKPVQNIDKQEQEQVVEDDPFGCVGMRLDGKPKKKEQLGEANPRVSSVKKPRGIPDYDYKLGTLTFDRSVKPIENQPTNNNNTNTDDDDKWAGVGIALGEK